MLTLREQGLHGLPQAIVSSLVMGLFALLVLPLAWWITMSRHWIVLDRVAKEVRRYSDWRFGLHVKSEPFCSYRSIRVAAEPLTTSTGSSQRRSSSAIVQMIRLLPHHADEVPSVSLGFLPQSEVEEATTLANQIADWISVPVEVGDLDRLYKP